MSAETLEWLNTKTLIGFTDKRGKAWHYKKEEQGDRSNHYPGAIPVGDVVERLFNFSVVERRRAVELPVGTIIAEADLTTDEFKGMTKAQKEALVGTRRMEWVVQVDEKAMCTDDDNVVLGNFKSGYRGHDYKEWLLDNVANILDDELAIGSAGLLRNRALAWVSVEVPENITTPEGVVFRPNLVACTSFDGSKVTTFKRTVTHVVCDNTLTAGLSGAGEVFKVKHSKKSLDKLAGVRDALSIVHAVEEEFAAEVTRLCNISVSEAQWARVKDIMVPVPTDPGMGRTMAENKRNRLDELWNYDSRVAPWSETGFGVLQAFNTWQHHDSRVKGGVHRGVRNMDNVFSGKQAQQDNEALKALELALV